MPVWVKSQISEVRDWVKSLVSEVQDFSYELLVKVLYYLCRMHCRSRWTGYSHVLQPQLQFLLHSFDILSKPTHEQQKYVMYVLMILLKWFTCVGIRLYLMIRWEPFSPSLTSSEGKTTPGFCAWHVQCAQEFSHHHSITQAVFSHGAI